MGPLDTTVAFETPERVAFRHRLAGVGLRSVAWAIDAGIQLTLVVGVILGAALTGTLDPVVAGLGEGVIAVVVFASGWLYALVFEAAWAGRTPGKLALGLRVVRRDGARVGVREAVLRNLLRGADSLPVGYVVGGLAAMADPAFRRLGDRVAGTIVVVEARPGDLAPVTPEPPTDEERAAWLGRGALRPAEAQAVELLLRRAPHLGPARAEELASRLVAALVTPPPEAPRALRRLELAWLRGRDS